MSHASLVVVLPPGTKDVEKAVGTLMAPFSEEDCCFRDGSRWDWYQIGGRYKGRLTDYDPVLDVRNYERCIYCLGSGVRRDSVGTDNGFRGMQPELNDEVCYKYEISALERKLANVVKSADGRKRCLRCGSTRNEGLTPSCTCQGYCNACGGSGFHLKFSSAWVPYDKDICKKSEVRKNLSAWGVLTAIEETHKGRNGHTYTRKLIRWLEKARMGWFGDSTQTECQRAGSVAVAGLPKVCKFARGKIEIVSWDEPADWSEKFYERFIAPLPDDTIVVIVDYHV